MQVVLVRSSVESNALMRLQSDALVEGLAGRADAVVRTVHPGDPQLTAICADASVIAFHHFDHAAGDAVRAVRVASPGSTPGARPKTVACLGSDIGSFEDYVRVDDIVEVFLMPTELHREVLRAGVVSPVGVLPERWDPVVGRPVEGFGGRARARRLCWFGYPESFTRSMASLVGIVESARAAGTVDDVAVITRARPGQDRMPFRVVPYEDDTFASELASFDYAVLSHFPLDLHLSTYAKSPNKAITALLAGVIPLASRTPSYTKLFAELGISRFLFGSPGELAEMLKGLDPVDDARTLDELGVLGTLLDRFSTARVAEVFLSHARPHPTVPQHGATWSGSLPVTMSLGEHLRDLAPSVRRAASRRVRARRLGHELS